MRYVSPKLLVQATLTALVGLAFYRMMDSRRDGSSTAGRALVAHPAPAGMLPAAPASAEEAAPQIERREMLLLAAPQERLPPRGRLGWTGPTLAVLAIVFLGTAWWLPARERRIRDEANRATGGVVERAVPVMLANGCAGCHTITGVPAAQGKTGPPLDSSLSQKLYIAGSLPNNLQNMVTWLRFSRDVDPHTAMPSTGISEQDARDIAAYLYALR